MAKPIPGEYPAHFETYISLVDAGDSASIIHKYAADLNSFYTSLPESKADYAYAEGKWTLKEVLQHVMDTERIFSYRLMCIARKDTTPLPSFDENAYITHSFASSRSLASLQEEFIAIRQSTDLLIQSLNNDQLSATGISGAHPAKANSFVSIIYGHLLHHRNITAERYLKN